MQVRNDGGLEQGRSSDGGEWELNYEYILKVEPVGFAEVVCERKRGSWMTQGFLALEIGKIRLLFTKIGKILGGW